MDGADELRSILGWWQLAGVDVAVDDAPRQWLRAHAETAPPQPASVAPATDTALPGTLEALVAWTLSPENLPQLLGPRIGPVGASASGVMLFTDMPDQEDGAQGELFSGLAGRLLDNLLAAIGRDRTSVYIASLAPARPMSGMLDQPLQEELGRVARHHASVASPKMLIMLGDTTTRVFTGMSLAEARGKLHSINLDCGTVRAIATFHPRFLLKQPACKADAWADLRLTLEMLNS